MAHTAVVRPLAELDLGDEARLDPDHVALAHTGQGRPYGKRTRGSSEWGHHLQQPVDLLGVETGADIANVAQPGAFVDSEHERSEGVGAAALTPRVAGNNELLPAVRLDLQPVARALPLRVFG